MKDLYQVIKRPIITEKSAALSAAEGKYTFEVDKRASKGDIKRAVEKLFEVAVLEVNTARVHGKRARGDWKKAVVTIKKGDKIEIFEA